MLKKFLHSYVFLAFFLYLTFRYKNQESIIRWKRRSGICLVHHDDNYDGRIDFSEIAPNSLEFNSYEECESACKNAKIQACRYTDEGACLYDLKVDKIVTNVVRILGPLYYECEIINDGNAQF